SNARYAQGLFLLGSNTGTPKPTATLTNTEITTLSDHSDGAYNANGSLYITESDIGTGRLGTSSYSPAITSYGQLASTTLTDIYALTSGDYSPVLKVYSADAKTATANHLTVQNSELYSHGQNSPVLYSTGKVTITASIMSADCSAGVVLDGNGQVTITNTSIDLEHTYAAAKNIDHPAILIGSSISGDAVFSMTGGHITTDKGDIFSVTGTKAAITLSGVKITNQDSSANLLKAASGNSTNSTVTFTATDQSMTGNITANTGSTVSATLSGKSVLAGSVNKGNPNGNVSLSFQSANSEAPAWYLTANSYVTSLTNNGTIVAGSHKLYVNGILHSNDANFYSEYTADSSDVITISTLALPSGKTSVYYSAYIEAKSSSDISFDIADGSIPAGLTIDEATGEILGTPTTAGTYTFIVEAFNENYVTAQQYTLVITDGSAEHVEIVTEKLNDASTYSPYSTALAASGAGTIVWSVEDGFTLPNGLTLNSETGIISGTPTRAGTYTFMVRAEVSSTNYYTKLLTLKVVEGSDVFMILTDSLKDGTINKSYNVVLKAKCSGTLTWSADKLPDGLSINTDTGKISGKPTKVGTYNPAFTVTNRTESATTTLSIVIKDIKPKIKASVKAGMIDTAYTATFTASAGTGTITWELSGDLPILPNGLTFDAEKATITGKPTEGWNGSFVIMATNTGGTTSKTCKLKIKAIKPKFTFKNPPAATYLEPYTAEAQLTGSQPIVLDVKGLPAGLSYDYDAFDEVVRIYGTPTEGGKFSVKMTATNVQGKGSKSAKIVVNFPPEIQDITLADAYTGKNYTAKFKAEGTKKILWYVASGDLPEGLTLKPTNGQLKGKPAEGGTFSFYVVAENSYGSDTKSVDLVVKVTPPKISTNSLKKGKYNKAYSVTLKTKDGTPDSWDITGYLPKGITFSGGVFSGTPEEAFTGSVIVTASNAGGSDKKIYTLVIAADAPKVTTTSLPGGTVGQAYSATLEATGTPPFVWRWSGYPAGLTLSKDTGVISGIPTKAGTFKITVTAENSAKITTKKYKVDIVDPSGSENVGNAGKSPEDSEIDGEDSESESDSSAEEYRLLAEHYAATGELPEGFVIAAELPAVSAEVSRMYDFEAELSESAPISAKMYWLANSETPSEDDGIAEFFSEDGQEIDSVPENRRVS
ncbi:MAG: putative Ig domain-containing protein, partial [Synergistaceae bacterium]|nr:putative Ig domain-containing protein [Synergistaceae bacterium]